MLVGRSPCACRLPLPPPLEVGGGAVAVGSAVAGQVVEEDESIAVDVEVVVAVQVEGKVAAVKAGSVVAVSCCVCCVACVGGAVRLWLIQKWEL